ncbi:MAG TPA: PEP/pyruvate-binding domain-containing protein [Clostridia bacterium]|nr:PEP/pyruvate-binding domain-containing protein [Clostridia bacterium]
MILWFEEIGKSDIPRVGGKGANLGEMTGAGFLVPPGFCITTAAYREHISDMGLKHLIDRVAGDGSGMDAALRAEETAERIRRAIEDTPMSARTEESIRSAYAKLTGQDAVYVAVRSSATAEDLKDASFAGQQETYLFVGDFESLLKYVKKCWASLWSPRSIAYRHRSGFDDRSVEIAVVVQIMVRSEKSGVLFTVNPLTGNSGEMLVNASYGLGEGIVSGRVTPDSWRLSKMSENFPNGRTPADYPVTESILGSKAIRTVAAPGGLTVDEPVPDNLRRAYCLDEKELLQLLLLGEKVERHYNCPQDIEWAIEKGRLYLLQARPITTMPKACKDNNNNDGNVSKTALSTQKNSKSEKAMQKLMDNFKEHIPDPPYPMDYEPLLLLNGQKNAAIRELGITMPPVEKIIKMDDYGVLSVGSLRPRPNIRLLCLPVTLHGLIALAPSGKARLSEENLESKFGELSRKYVKTLENVELAFHIGELEELSMQYILLRFRAYVFPMLFLGIRLRLLTGLFAGQRGVSQYDFLADLGYKTAEIENAMYTLAGDASEIPGLSEMLLKSRPEISDFLGQTSEGRSFIKKLDEFLELHGSRSNKAYMPFSTESWRERPEVFLNTLSLLVKSGNVGRREEIQKAAKDRYRNLVSTTEKKLPRFLRTRFQHTLDLFRNAHTGREALLYRMEECYGLLRAAVGEAADRLVQSGALYDAGDARFMLLDELKQALQGHTDIMKISDKIDGRKAHRSEAEAAWNGKGRNKASSDDGESLKAEILLKGMPGSPGQAEGIVKIIDDPAEFSKLQNGDVLVCRFTDPSWTPLFSIACAVVCDTGGPLSHAAIVAREYGIPAVLGTGNATSALKNGIAAKVDGSSGTVSASSL